MASGRLHCLSKHLFECRKALSGVMAVPYAFDPAINALSLLFSAFIGVVFGYFPARRAAQMDPIEALRHE